ncbi:MAG: hypothetical protein LBV21_06985 [Candidatus Adiutrix sp.]|nr:hypothetical protein [Candidatus Adiutrix sp.]
MRLEDFLNQTTAAKHMSDRRKPPEGNYFTPPRENTDSVKISPEAKAARKSGNYFTPPAQETSQAHRDFKTYMDKVTGRVLTPPKTPAEKLKELAEKVKQLQAKLGEVIADGNLSEATQNDRAETLTAQIKALQIRMSGVAKEMTGQETADD